MHFWIEWRMAKKIKIGVIRPEDIKVRKKSPPPTQVQKSPKDYDRKQMKKDTRKEVSDE